MPHLDANGQRLFHRFDGKAGAPPLLLSHSLGSDLGLWDPQVESFAKRFHVLRYDARGHGRSSIPKGPCTLEDLGRDALGLLDALGIAKVRFCGLSMGGMVGMWLGTHAPERIERLALCNTAPWMGPKEVWDQRIAAVREGGMDAVADGVLERWFTSDFRARAPEEVARVRRTLCSTSPEGYAACCAALRDMDLREGLGRIRAPTLVVAGKRDPSTPPEQARYVAAQVPGARLEELDAAHLSNIEAKEPFTAAVLDFLVA